MCGCRKCCNEVDFGCICHKRPKENCRCKERKDQYCPKVVKDCVCVEWSVQPGRTQTVFQTAGFRSIFASGFVSFDFGNLDSVIVRFFLGSNQVGPSVRVFEDSSVAFSYTKFDRITVEYTLTNPISPESGEGEICIKTRTPIN